MEALGIVDSVEDHRERRGQRRGSAPPAGCVGGANVSEVSGPVSPNRFTLSGRRAKSTYFDELSLLLHRVIGTLTSGTENAGRNAPPHARDATGVHASG
jgi:hypothetical protein